MLPARIKVLLLPHLHGDFGEILVAVIGEHRARAASRVSLGLGSLGPRGVNSESWLQAQEKRG